MKTALVILTALAIFTAGVQTGFWINHHRAEQYRILYHQALEFQHQTLPHKTKAERLLWKVQG